jgi:DNA-binding MarR family transcriptional regulator
MEEVVTTTPTDSPATTSESTDGPTPAVDARPKAGIYPAETAAINALAGEAATRIGNDCLGFRLRLLDRVATRIFNQELQPLGIRHTQLILLVAMQKLGSSTPVRLGQWLSIEKSTLSRNLGLLKKSGYARAADPENPKSTAIAITDRGVELLAQALPLWEQAQQKVAELFGAESEIQIRKIVRHYWQQG